ncbi:MAG TPA: acyltransferase, partial [Sphingomicrobium sp.]|nr:acyltransferase [Sphingomicrobium sp.]
SAFHPLRSFAAAVPRHEQDPPTIVRKPFVVTYRDMGRLKSIDMIRGLAATAVVFHHSHGQSSIGKIGVDFFFVVSGFVIFHSAQGRSAAEFLGARFWRIFPLYWIAVIPWLVISFVRHEMDGPHLAEQILLAPLWWTSNVPLLFLAWTLTFECLFYTAAAVSIQIRTVLPALGLFAVAAMGWGAGLSHRLMWLGNPMILEFIMGILVALAPRNRLAGAIAMAGGLAWLMLFPTTSYSMEFRDFTAACGRVLLWGIPAALIVYGAVTFERHLSGRIVVALCGVGTASYSIYLFHPLIADVIINVWWPLKFIGAFSLGVAAWAFFERPIARWRPLPLANWHLAFARLRPIVLNRQNER